ncbi:Protein kinase domain-containing protein [Mycena indigotica]|uniref:Protein kinase domain-containing protein n=1 Tax=Mycena indigotica TaxID=2126181 RepID=A0A8H6SPK0_9AGAR|nr:Protein kinase domain-containing protein [Mycena indigotica]KAF7303650.1 Protein kinase domain-containing protein [Mycena indigotica]
MPTVNDQRPSQSKAPRRRRYRTRRDSQNDSGRPKPLYFGEVAAETPTLNMQYARSRRRSFGGVNVDPTSLGSTSRAAMQSVTSLVSLVSPVKLGKRRDTSGDLSSGSHLGHLFTNVQKALPSVLKKSSRSEAASPVLSPGAESSRRLTPRKRVSFSFTSTKRGDASVRPDSHNKPVEKGISQDAGRAPSRRPSIASLFRRGKKGASDELSNRPAKAEQLHLQIGEASENTQVQTSVSTQQPTSDNMSKRTRDRTKSWLKRWSGKAQRPDQTSPNNAIPPVNSVTLENPLTEPVPAYRPQVASNSVELPESMVSYPIFVETSDGAEPYDLLHSWGPQVIPIVRLPRGSNTSRHVDASSIPFPAKGNEPAREFPSALAKACKYSLHENLLRCLWTQAQSSPNVQSRILKLLRTVKSETSNLVPVIYDLVHAMDTRIELNQLADLLLMPNDELNEALKADRLAMKKSLIESQNEILRQPTSHKGIVDVIQDIIDNRDSTDKIAHDLPLVKLLTKISLSSGKPPRSLLIEAVTERTQQRIAAGGFADIYQAQYKGSLVALKQLRLYQNDTEETLRKHREKFLQEVFLWKYFSHPHILPFLGLYQDPSVPDMDPLCSLFMVCPWMKNKTIGQYVANNPLLAVEPMLLEIAQALEYLHSELVVHGDLRGDNILIDDNGHVQLADFGVASYMNSTIESSTRRGTTRWMAPELLLPEPGQIFRRTRESDVYAFACVCYELYHGGPPFSDIDASGAIVLHPVGAVLRQVSECLRPLRMPPSKFTAPIWRLITTCWHQEPKSRLKVAQIVEQLVLLQQEQADRKAGTISEPQAVYRPPRSRNSSLVPEPSSSSAPSRAPSLRVSLLPPKSSPAWGSTSSFNIFLHGSNEGKSSNWRNKLSRLFTNTDAAVGESASQHSVASFRSKKRLSGLAMPWKT